MAFRFRLQTSLRLAEQEVDIVRALLAQEISRLRDMTDKRDNQERIFKQALAGQTSACITEPHNLHLWQAYTGEQKEILKVLEVQIEEQKIRVEEKRQLLVEHRIKAEKYIRLKEKQAKHYKLEELRKEQSLIDEIAQNHKGSS
ncbi:flagellar FliJ family protein [Dehalobacter sp. DCM]|uniref:flagellar export protein FliJ n=1 Tax=Dehalobacter sp. DCM TaxID=2907827 RepID=UPI0030821E11|nr:flagellar FliJ family protein [Dehalobacter sp. DCM]